MPYGITQRAENCLNHSARLPEHNHFVARRILHGEKTSKVDWLLLNTAVVGVSSHLLDRLQSVLNAAVRLVFSARLPKHHAAPSRPHWLPVLERIQFRRFCIPTYCCLNGTDLSYLAESTCRVADVEVRCQL